MAVSSISRWTARDQVQVANYPKFKQQIVAAVNAEQQERVISIVRDSLRETTDIENVSWLPEYFGGDSEEIGSKKALMGALRLYLDFINLFIMLLRLFGQRR